MFVFRRRAVTFHVFSHRFVIAFCYYSLLSPTWDSLWERINKLLIDSHLVREINTSGQKMYSPVTHCWRLSVLYSMYGRWVGELYTVVRYSMLCSGATCALDLLIFVNVKIVSGSVAVLKLVYSSLVLPFNKWDLSHWQSLAVLRSSFPVIRVEAQYSTVHPVRNSKA